MILIFVSSPVSASPDDNRNVSLGVILRGTADQNGSLTIVMSRVYENTELTRQKFIDRLDMPYEQIKTLNMEVLSKSEGLIIEKGERDIYKISGTLDPSETKTITIKYSLEMRILTTKYNKYGESYKQFIPLYIAGENVKTSTLLVNFNLPQGTTKFGDNEIRVVENKDNGEPFIYYIEPDTSLIKNVSWFIQNKESTVKENSEAIKNEYNLSMANHISFNLDYSVRVNSQSHLIKYLAIGLSLISIFLTLWLYNKVRKLNKCKAD